MVKYSNEQRLEIIKNYYQNSESIVQTLRALTPIFGRNNLPTSQAVRAIVTKFETTYSLLDGSVLLDESDEESEPVLELPTKKGPVVEEGPPPVKRARGRPPKVSSKKAKASAKKDKKESDDEDEAKKESSNEAESS